MDGAIPRSVSVALLQVHLQGLPLLTLASLPGVFLVFLSWLRVRSDVRTTPFSLMVRLSTNCASTAFLWNTLLAWDFSVQAAHAGTLRTLGSPVRSPGCTSATGYIRRYAQARAGGAIRFACLNWTLS